MGSPERRSLLVPTLLACTVLLVAGTAWVVSGTLSRPPSPPPETPERLDPDPPGERVVAGTPSEIRATVEVLTPTSESVGGLVLAGEVVHADGRIAPEAALRFEDEHGRTVRRATTGADGRFSVRLETGAGRLTLVAEKDGLVSERLAVVPTPGLRRESLRLTLGPGAMLEGTVRDALEGRTLDECTVRSGERTFACNRHGRFVLGPLAPGGLAMRIESTDYAPREVFVELTRGQRASVDVLLTRGGTLAGTVRDPDGRPMPGVAVRSAHYSIAGGSAPEVGGVSDETGTFALRGVAPGRVSVRAQAAGFAEASSREVNLGAGERHDGLEVTLGTGGALAGQVARLGGEGAGGAIVEVLRLADRTLVARTTAAADGTFRIDGLASGQYTAVASAGDERGLAPSLTIAERAETEVTILLGGDGVSGRVVDDRGAPVAGARVEVTSSYGGGLGARVAGTDAAGRFTIDGIVGAPFRVEARHGSAVAEARGIPAGGEVTLTLVPAGRIEGLVVDDAGRAVTDVVVTITPDAAAAEAIAARFRSQRQLAPDGTFVLEGVPVGGYTVRVASAGLMTGTERAEVRADETTRVRLMLAGGASASGRTTRDGVPVAGCRVREARRGSGFFARAGDELGVAVTGGEGTFTLGGLRPGETMLWAWCPGGLFGNALVKAANGGRASGIEIALRQGRESEDEEFGGIGASLRMSREGELVFAELIEGGPAHLAGIVRGDVVLAIDGWPAAGRTIGEAIDRIRGPLGTPVAFELRRGGQLLRTVAERVRIAQ